MPTNAVSLKKFKIVKKMSDNEIQMLKASRIESKISLSKKKIQNQKFT